MPAQGREPGLVWVTAGTCVGTIVRIVHKHWHKTATMLGHWCEPPSVLKPNTLPHNVTLTTQELRTINHRFY